ncbi:LOW QUALITY PROTEIN: Mucosal addressin cell adhesion molecule 1, partial [Galemys pyrenaicus]
GSLEVEPLQPVVALGGSLQLTCRLTCADPAEASVAWKGLDTSLGSVRQEADASVLSVANASLSDEGMRMCQGSCRGLTYLKTVTIRVFAFPEQLAASPVALVAGRAQTASCTAHNVTPFDPDSLSLSLLLGDRELEGVRALGREEEEEPPDGEDVLFRVTEHWLLPPLEPPALPTLHCRATLRLPGLELSHLLPIPVCAPPQKAGVTAPRSGALHRLSTSQHNAQALGRASRPQAVTLRPSPSRLSTAGPSTDPRKVRNPTPTALWAPMSLEDKPTFSRVQGSLHSLPPTRPHLLPYPTPTVLQPRILPISTSKEPLATASLQPPLSSLHPPASSLQPPPSSPWSPGHTPKNSSTGPCHLEIHQSPVPGGLELLCEATCGPGGTVHWTQAPGGLAAYEWRKAGARAWLSMQWARCSPEGWFQCRLDPGGWMANLYVVPEMCES